MRTIVFTFLGAVLLAAPALAQDTDADIIVTASRGGSAPADLWGGSATIFSSDEIETRQVRVVADILRDAPGVSVSRLGGVGSQTQIRIRGTEANHTLVLIDGIEASDPFQGEFDFAALNADEAARIEVLRGAQSALYGSDAIGGVVHYQTLSGAEAPGWRGRVEGGSFETFDAAARWAGVAGPLDFALSGAFSETGGSNIARSGDEDDGAQTKSVHARLGFDVSPVLTLRAIGRYVGSEADTDPQDFFTGFVVDSTGYRTRQQARYGLVGARLETLSGRWTHDLSAQVTDVERRNDDPFFAFFTDGRREKVSYVSNFTVQGADASHALTGAIDYERETYRNVPVGAAGPENAERALETTGLVAQYRFAWRDQFGFGAAVRHDANDRFEDATTLRADASYRFATGTRVRGAYATGVKNPTNFELFGFDPTSFLGNPDLKPETSEGWELGAEQSIGPARIGVTYFSAELEDEIFTSFGGPPNFLSTADNRTTSSKQDGVEAFAQVDIGAGWTLEAAYAWLDAEENGAREIRRPEHSGSVNLAWRGARGGAYLTVRYNGETEDDAFITFPATRVTQDAYALVNVGGDWRLSEAVSLHGRVENALDETYEDVFSYATPGAAGFVGLKAAF
ncbi:MAG: TonB-dependent receptor [Alphaproteobacteria bacterium]|nr:TonB-dependent receptor [Alphaproteobacteria bacterium]